MTTLDQIKAIVGDKVGFAANTIMDDAWLGPRDPSLQLGRQFLDLDSLDRLELAQQIEEHFDIAIPDAETDKPEMGTPAGLAAYVEKVLQMSGSFPINEDAVSAVDVIDAVPLADSAVETDAAGPRKGEPDYPINRDELLRRGFDETLDGSILAAINALGFPTPDNPMGTNATHEMVPIGSAAGAEAANTKTPLESVQFIRIEPMSPIDRIHFAVEIEDMPEWLMEAIGLGSEDPGAIWADQGVLFVNTKNGRFPVKPGQFIHHTVIDQLSIEDSPIF